MIEMGVGVEHRIQGAEARAQRLGQGSFVQIIEFTADWQAMGVPVSGSWG